MRRRKMRIKMDRPRLYALLLLVAHRKAREHGEVDFGGYLLDLSSNLVQFQSAIRKTIHLDAKCEHLHVTLNTDENQNRCLTGDYFCQQGLTTATKAMVTQPATTESAPPLD
jgi:hypothetical protein